MFYLNGVVYRKLDKTVLAGMVNTCQSVGEEYICQASNKFEKNATDCLQKFNPSYSLENLPLMSWNSWQLSSPWRRRCFAVRASAWATWRHRCLAQCLWRHRCFLSAEFSPVVLDDVLLLPTPAMSTSGNLSRQPLFVFVWIVSSFHLMCTHLHTYIGTQKTMRITYV
jgi:hypothetical protein